MDHAAADTESADSVAWIKRHGNLLVLIGALIVVGGTWLFVVIAAEVKEGDTQQFDDWAIRALRRPDSPAIPIGPVWLHEVGRDMTALGGVAVMALITGAVAVYLLLVRK